VPPTSCAAGRGPASRASPAKGRRRQGHSIAPPTPVAPLQIKRLIDGLLGSDWKEEKSYGAGA
jgi:hypothetical protein